MKRLQLNKNILLIFFLISMVLLACTPSLKSPSDMAPPDFSIWANRIYESAYDGYLEDIKKPNLTEEQRAVLRKKKEILTELQPKLLMYGRYLQTGSVPEAEVTQTIIDLIGKLNL